jgi:uncharacterized protein YpmS
MTELWNNWYETLVSIEALATIIVIAVVAAGVILIRSRYGSRSCKGQSLSGASFTSLKQLQEHIDAYINAYNDKAEPFLLDQEKGPSTQVQRSPYHSPQFRY